MQPEDLPTYREHSTGQAFLEWNKKRYYLGKHGSKKSHEKFNRFIAALLVDENPLPALADLPVYPVFKLVHQYLDHCKDYYPDSNEYQTIRSAFVPLLEIHGNTAAKAFGPKALREVRAKMIELGWVRDSINKQVNRIRAMYKWAVSHEKLEPDTLAKLKTVETLGRGRSKAPESKPVEPISDYWVAATLPFMSPTAALMVRVQRVGGMRPSDVCRMKGREIDRTGEIWLYRPPVHKNAYRDQPRVCAIPPSVQADLLPLLDNPDAYVFSPKDSLVHKRHRLREARKSKVQPSQAKRKESVSPTVRDHYDTGTYRNAIKYGISRANKAARAAAKKDGREPALVPDWTPNRLRHTAADEAERILGPIAAQRLLGHANLSTTEIYLSQHVAELVRVATLLDKERATPPSAP